MRGGETISKPACRLHSSFGRVGKYNFYPRENTTRRKWSRSCLTIWSSFVRKSIVIKMRVCYHILVIDKQKSNTSEGRNHMKKINTLTEQEEAAFAQSLVEDYGADSYQDLAEILYAIAVNCDYCLKYVPDCLEDETEKRNTAYLRDMLEVCANMMQDCDSYYRNRY